MNASVRKAEEYHIEKNGIRMLCILEAHCIGARYNSACEDRLHHTRGEKLLSR
jgi:hypothetical protein